MENIVFTVTVRVPWKGAFSIGGFDLHCEEGNRFVRIGHSLSQKETTLKAVSIGSWRSLRRHPFAALLVLVLLAGCGASGDRLEAYNAFAIEAAQLGLWREAAFRWEQALALDEDDARIWNNLGVAYETEERFDDAIAAYKEALRRDPGNTRYLRNLRRCERHVERVAAARTDEKPSDDEPSPSNETPPDPPPEATE